MRFFHDLPIRRKLTAISLLTSGAALLLTCAAFIVYEQVSFRRDMERELEITAEIIGANSASSLSFEDNDSAALTLKSLAAQPRIVRGCVYDKSGKVFATYRRDPRATSPWPEPRADAAVLDSDSLDLFHTIRFTDDAIGAIYLESDLDELHARRWNYLAIAGSVFLGAILVTWLVASRLQLLISRPISELAATAGRVGAEKAYSIRAIKRGDDEIGRLIDGFNGMLAQIEARDAELHAAHRDLERRVEERTRSLEEARQEATLERARFKFIFDSLPVGVAWMIQDRRDTRVVNPSYARITGIPIDERHELERYLEATHPEDRPAQQALNEKLRRGEIDQYTLEKRYLRGDGSLCWASHTLRFVRDAVTGEVQELTTLVDITERKNAETRVEEIHKQLIRTSHQAGMAEVATGVLHNVGNVLNSVNVSATLVADLVRRSKAPNLGKVRDLLDQHRADLGRYLTEDPKGRMIPAYLSTLAESLSSEQKTIVGELENLHKNIGHIKDIVAMQQSYAKTSGVSETVSVPDLVEDAIRMNAGSLARHDVAVVREYDARPVVTVDKNKVLQILVNLIRNAKYACDESGRTDKRVVIRTRADSAGVDISVVDNGVGIHPDNLTRIFAHGFTTRKHGHGFGLHSGALAAKAMGGSLSALSEGPGKGAAFILRLPFKPADQPE